MENLLSSELLHGYDSRGKEGRESVTPPIFTESDIYKHCYISHNDYISGHPFCNTFIVKSFNLQLTTFTE